jgi:mRNA-degrading endonuclease RelE of RelBE toxin-antitoxin system
LVSLAVVFRETALRNLAQIRGEDKDLFTRTRRAISALADQPIRRVRSPGGRHRRVYRLHAGDIRILYEVDDQAATVYIINIGILTEIALRAIPAWRP